MLSYKDFTKHFGSSLADQDFQSFLKRTFTDLADYNILESDYIVFEKGGIEIGFTKKDVVFDDDNNVVFENGHSIFSHFIMHPKAAAVVAELPFHITFGDTRSMILKKAGNPTETSRAELLLLHSNFLVDSYTIGRIVITFDYNTINETIKFIQIRDSNLAEQLKL